MAEWIALDWGTSSFRAYLVRDKFILDKISTNDGMKFVSKANFKNILIKNICVWLKSYNIKTILVSGMVGSKQGWVEVPYKKCPCSVLKLNFTKIKISKKINVIILSGISQQRPDDVMRGEETQIAGYLLKNKFFEGSICLPGTHSKWVQILDMKIIKFNTFLTGELFEIIKKNSILCHNLNSNKIDEKIVLKSAKNIMVDPSFFTNKLFNIRAKGLLRDTSDIENNSILTGYILAMEIIASKSYWENKDVILIGSKKLNRLYELILHKKCKSITNIKSDEMTVKGLSFFKENLDL